MKAKSLITLSILASGMLLAACSSSPAASSSASSQSSSSAPSSSLPSEPSESSSSQPEISSSSSEQSSDTSSEQSQITSTFVSSAEAVTSFDDGAFSMSTEDGSFSVSGDTITILSAGTYVLQGTWQGMIYGDLTDDDVVELDLNGVTLSNASNSCIYFLNADKLKIKSIEGTTNNVIDERALQTEEDDTQGGGAIYSKCDTNFVGKGTLNVVGTFNNGIHVTKDLSVKNVTLNASAPNNVLKGKDSVTIESGKLTLVSSGGDGIKTVDTDISSSGKQRGTIEIKGGTINISAAYDGIDAAYDLNVSGGSISIKTNEYRTSSSASPLLGFGPGGGGGHGGGGGGGIPGGGGSSSEKAEESAKGLKADNQIVISGGTIDIAAYDDAIHANNDETLENGEAPLGNITITKGDITLKAADDAIHADGTLLISGGNILVTESWEGIEADVIEVTGGETIAYSTDDGINAHSAINVTGGLLFGAVNPNGDHDGIDSNGTITVDGGILIGAGPSNQMASAIDADGAITVKSGTLMAFGYGRVTASSVTASTKSGTFGNKAYTVTFANGTIEVPNLPYSYSGCKAWSSLGSISSIA